MTNGNPRITHLVHNALESSGVLDDTNEIQYATKFTASFGSFRAYILVFNMEGRLLLPETKIGDKKFEGIEFV